jgi:hypothetical protein
MDLSFFASRPTVYSTKPLHFPYQPTKSHGRKEKSLSIHHRFLIQQTVSLRDQGVDSTPRFASANRKCKGAGEGKEMVGGGRSGGDSVGVRGCVGFGVRVT